MTFLPFKKSESDVARHYSSNMKEPTRIEYVGHKATLGCIRQINVGSSVYSLSCYRGKILSGSSSGVCLWDEDSGELIREPFRGDASISSFVNYENRVVIANQDGVFGEWGTDTGEVIYSVPTVDIVRVISVSSGGWGYYATGFEDGAIQLWDRERKIAIGEPLRGHSGKVLALVFGGSMNDYLASGSEDQSIIVWDIKRREKKYAPLKGHSGPITSLEFMIGEEKLLSGSLDGTVRLWKASTGDVLHAFSASGTGGVYSVTDFGNEERYILSGSEDGIIRLWDIKHSEIPPKKFVGHTGKVISLSAACTEGGKGTHFASGSEDGTIRVWDMGRKPGIVEGPVFLIDVSLNGKHLVSASRFGTVSVWRIKTGELIRGPLEGDEYLAMSLSLSPDGSHFASGSQDGSVRIWDLKGHLVTCLTKSRRTVWAVCFSPNGRHLASGSENTIRIWNSRRGRLALKPFGGRSVLITSICYLPDGNRIVSGSSNGVIRVWDVLNGTLLIKLQGHNREITSVKYSHDGSYILSKSQDDTIRFTDADNGKPVREPIKLHQGSFGKVHLSPDGTHFVFEFGEPVRLSHDGFNWKFLNGMPVPSSNGPPVFLLPSPDSKHINFASVSDGYRLIRIYCVDIESKGIICDVPNADGWLIENDGNLVSWIPSDIRHTLIYGSCVGILNSRFTTKLTLSKYQGSQWTSCFPSSDIV